MKRNESMRKRILGKCVLYGYLISMILSVPFMVQAKEIQPVSKVVSLSNSQYTELSLTQIQQIQDSTALDAEFAELEEESVLIVEEVERQRAEARRSKIWGAIIIVLVMCIFSIGIVSTNKDKKNTGHTRKKSSSM